MLAAVIFIELSKILFQEGRVEIKIVWTMVFMEASVSISQ